MRLKYLKIQKFKNLRDFHIEFDSNSLTTVLVGRNGTGKSNLLEALTQIFRDLDLGEQSDFSYEIEYMCRQSHVKIVVDISRSRDQVVIKVDDQPCPLKDFARKGKSNGHYLPNNTFGYYSGRVERMREIFDKHRRQFKADLLAGVDRPLRPLLDVRLTHGQLALLSFFSNHGTKEAEFLEKYLRIQDLESVLIVLRKPEWYSAHRRMDGDPRFWGARGVVRQFLDKLYDASLAPVQSGQKQSQGIASDRLYLFLQDKQALIQLAGEYKSQAEFFKALDSMYISDLVEDVKAYVKVKGVEEALLSRELSEGEQQLLMVLGLLRFVKEDEDLFLLDEPDTHLNPAWSLEYVRLLKEAVEDQEPSQSQIIMVTHDPLVVASLVKSEVIIMSNEANGRILAEHPQNDPQGMGVSGLLTSEIYGLRSELDLDTMEKLDRKRDLALKRDKSEGEKSELQGLDLYLGSLDFSKTARDPYYKLFTEAMTDYEKDHGLQVPLLSAEQRIEQKRVALEIITKLRDQEDQEVETHQH